MPRMKLLAGPCGRSSVRALRHPHATELLLWGTLSGRESHLLAWARLITWLRRLLGLGVRPASQKPKDTTARFPGLGMVGNSALLGLHGREAIPRLPETSNSRIALLRSGGLPIHRIWLGGSSGGRGGGAGTRLRARANWRSTHRAWL